MIWALWSTGVGAGVWHRVASFQGALVWTKCGKRNMPASVERNERPPRGERCADCGRAT